MKITGYVFGRITIEGKDYASDVIIYPERVNPSWWRKEGHVLRPQDLEEALKAKPEIIVIGTGYSGAMKVPEETVEFLLGKGVEIRVERTGRAVEIFNALPPGKKAVAALHLTC